MKTPIRRLLAALLLVLACVVPAGAGAGDFSAADLDGTAWKARASVALRMRAVGETLAESGKLKGVESIEFDGDRFAIVDDDSEELVGTWSPDPDRPRQFTGTLDEGQTQELDADLQRRLEKIFRREIGRRVKVDFTLLSQEIKGRVSKGGGKLNVKVKLRYVMVVRVGGRGVRVKLAMHIRMRGKPTDA